MTPQKVREINAAALVALQAVAEKYGVAVKQSGAAKYSDLQFVVPYEFCEVAKCGAVMDATYRDLLQMTEISDWLRLSDILDREYQHSSLGPVRLVGYKRRSYKTPFIFQTKDGRRWKSDETTVRNLVDRARRAGVAE